MMPNFFCRNVASGLVGTRQFAHPGTAHKGKAAVLVSRLVVSRETRTDNWHKSSVKVYRYH